MDFNSLKHILLLMERMGEKVNSFHSFDLATQRHPLIIKEGLIQTYPTDRVVDAVAKNAHLKVWGETGNQLNTLRQKPKPFNGEIGVVYFNGNDENILVKIPSENLKAFENINAHLLKYGWVNFKQKIVDDKTFFYFEKKFGDRFTTEQLLNITDKIYHVTNSSLENKILKQGLIPKQSKTPGFNNEPRIYFLPNPPTKDEAYEIVRMKGKDEQPIIAEVDLKSLKKNQAFFFDSRWANSFFTFEPIPIAAITIKKP